MKNTRAPRSKNTLNQRKILIALKKEFNLGKNEFSRMKAGIIRHARQFEKSFKAYLKDFWNRVNAVGTSAVSKNKILIGNVFAI